MITPLEMARGLELAQSFIDGPQWQHASKLQAVCTALIEASNEIAGLKMRIEELEDSLAQEGFGCLTG